MAHNPPAWVADDPRFDHPAAAVARGGGDDPAVAAVAGAAIAAFQAMPELARGEVYDEMWAISRR